MSGWKCWNKSNFLLSEYQWTFVVDTWACYSLESHALIDNGWREKYIRAFAFGVRERAQWNYALSYLDGRVLYGESLGDTRVYMPTRVCSVHARSNRTTDERYSIAVCRICSLCWDHILVLIRAPDKIALCYRGSCLREREPPPVCFYLRPAPRFTLPFVIRLGLIRESSCEKKIVCFRRK